MDEKPDGVNPTNNSIKVFFEKVDADPELFPGKQCGETRGRKRVLQWCEGESTCCDS